MTPSLQLKETMHPLNVDAMLLKGNPPVDDFPNPLFATFTKSKNWAQRIIDELSDFIFILSTQGKIIFASSSCRSTVGFSSEEIISRPISEFVHPDDACQLSILLQAASIHRSPYRLILRFRRKNADYLMVEIHGRVMSDMEFAELRSPKQRTEMDQLHPLVINIAREYPDRFTPFLDSVLDLKLENESLYARKLELQSILLDQSVSRQERDTSYSSDSSSLASEKADECVLIKNVQLREEGMDNSVLAVKPPVLGTLISSFEEFTPRRRRRRTVKPPQERVCIDCGTTQSPEWRKGPTGSKTLCNACGLRYAKSAKLRSKE